MASRKRAAPAGTPAVPDAPPVIAPLEERTVTAVRILAGPVAACVACRTAEEALAVIGFVASARADGRMCLLPETAWLDSPCIVAGDPGRILIDPEGCAAWTVRLPASDVPALALAALDALPPSPAPAPADASPGGSARRPLPSCAGRAAAPWRAGGTPRCSSGRGPRARAR